MNVLTVTGHLTADPARRDTTKGVVCDFHLAVDGQRRLWLPVTCWGRLAGLCAKHLRAGRRVAVSGQLAVDEYITNDGQKQRRWYTKAERITFLDRPDGANAAGDRPHDRASCHDEQVSPKDGA
jgi:single-strand DNA-binding protein